MVPERSDLTQGGLRGEDSNSQGGFGGGEAPTDYGGVWGRQPPRCCLIYSVNRRFKPGDRRPRKPALS